MSAYTNADVSLVANHVPLGFTERDPYRDVDEAARAILDAVAPAIAARALREAASDYWSRTDLPSTFEPWSWLRDRAEKYERTP